MGRHLPGRVIGQVRTRGQAIVEWAVMMTVVLWLCLGGVDLGRAYGDYIGLTNAARIGARYAVLLPSATDAQILAQVQAEQPSLGITGAMVAVDRTLADRRTVTIAYPFTPFTPLVARFGDGTTLTLRTWAAMPLMEP
jgi:Flp pilus assembly protein TadG